MKSLDWEVGRRRGRVGRMIEARRNFARCYVWHSDRAINPWTWEVDIADSTICIGRSATEAKARQDAEEQLAAFAKKLLGDA